MRIGGNNRTLLLTFLLGPWFSGKLRLLERLSQQELLELWRCGNDHAGRLIVERYLVRLSALVRSRLSVRLSRRVDPEDIVVSVWRSFFLASRKGRIAVSDDGEFWSLLATIALRKVARKREHNSTQRRSIDREAPMTHEEFVTLAAGNEPGPVAAAIVAEQVEWVLTRLPLREREVFVRTLQGATCPEIAAELGCSDRTVRRDLDRIRVLCSKHTDIAIALRTAQSDDRAAAVLPTNERPQSPGPDTSGTQHGVPVLDWSDLQLKQLVGRGGFGKLYRAEIRSTGEIVAAKFLRKRFWHDRQAVVALRRECDLLAALTDPGIVAIRGWCDVPGCSGLLLQEWIDGESLDVWMARADPGVEERVAAVADVARAVAVAHAHGIVHCDLKPPNVLRGRDGRVVLTDFGMGHALRPESLVELRGGTATFLAPEQISAAFGPISFQTDVYGLGGLLYTCLAGRPPAPGTSIPEITAWVLSSTAAEPVQPAVPKVLNDIMMHCLRKEPSQRLSTVGELVAGLDAWLQSELKTPTVALDAVPVTWRRR